MRDDLHKTVSLGKRWRAVLRRLSRDKYSPELLAPCIVETVYKELFNPNDPGWKCVESVLMDLDEDLFEHREVRIMAGLTSLQDAGLSPQAQFCCEMAMGVLALEGWTPALLNTVSKTAGEAYANNQCEHIVAEVSLSSDLYQATAVSRALSDSLRICDFTAPGRLGPAPKKSISELLDTSLDLFI